MNAISNVPYSHLSPEVIIEAIENLNIHCTGSLLALNSYENRVYQLGIESAESHNSEYLVAKFYRPHRWTNAAILEEHQFAHELAALEIPVIAPLTINNNTLHHFKEFRFALFPRKRGRALELNNLMQLEWMGRFIGRLHAVSQCRDFQYRTRLDIESYGYHSYRFLMESNFIPIYLKERFSQLVESLLEQIEQNFKRIGPIQYIRLHGDCHPGNILWNDDGPQIVDLDDCIMGPAIQDIWMLLAGDEDQLKTQLDCILQGYSEFCDFNYREIGLIESLRTLRILQYSAWLGKRWNDPAFPLNFPFFNTPHYWQELMHNLTYQQEKL